MKFVGWARRSAPLWPLVAVAGVLLWRGQVLEAEAERREAVLVAQQLTSVFESSVGRTEMALRLLGLSPRMLAQDWHGLHGEARAAATLVLGNNIVVYDEGGAQRLNTLLPADAALPTQRATPAQLLEVFRRPDAVLSDLFVGPVTGTRLAALGVPAPAGVSPPLGIGIGISPDQIARLLEAGGLPEGWIAAAVDRQGVIAARTRESARFVGQPTVPELKAAMAVSPEGSLAAVTQEGLDVWVAYRRSERLGWTIAVAAPREAGRRQRQWHAWLGLAAIAAAGAAGLALASHRGQAG